MRAGWVVAGVVALAGGALLWAMTAGQGDRANDALQRDVLPMEEGRALRRW